MTERLADHDERLQIHDRAYVEVRIFGDAAGDVARGLLDQTQALDDPVDLAALNDAYSRRSPRRIQGVSERLKKGLACCGIYRQAGFRLRKPSSIFQKLVRERCRFQRLDSA
jgi:hypothetical protein